MVLIIQEHNLKTLRELVDQFADVFSTTAGLTILISKPLRELWYVILISSWSISLHKSNVNNVLICKAEFELQVDFILTDYAEQLILHSYSSYHKHGDEAHQLRHQAASWLIPQIQNTCHELIFVPGGINAIFKCFYVQLNLRLISMI